MKTFLKEIQTYIIIGVIALAAVSILLVRIKNTQSSANVNLIEMVPSSATAFIRINNPNNLRKYILSDKNIKEAFKSEIPEVFLSIIHFIQGNQSSLCSFHPQGIIFYAHVNEFQEKNIKEKILRPCFGSFAPQSQKIAGTDIKYYAGKENRFLGYYTKGGILVASYSRKLLEETLVRQAGKINKELSNIVNEADKKAPFNLFIHSDLLNLYINLTDSTMWKLKDRWLSADFFMNKNRLCYFSSLPYIKDIDSLYTPLADTLTLRIQSVFPQMRITSETNQDNDKMLYTGRFE